jgi:hypothetical protein
MNEKEKRVGGGMGEKEIQIPPFLFWLLLSY